MFCIFGTPGLALVCLFGLFFPLAYVDQCPYDAPGRALLCQFADLPRIGLFFVSL